MRVKKNAEVNINNELVELVQLVDRFLSSFECVFDEDWEHTRACIKHENKSGECLRFRGDTYITMSCKNCDCTEEEKDNYWISDKGTFLNHLIEDEDNNWWNRGSLLSNYRRLRKALEKYGKYSYERHLEIEEALESCRGAWN